MRARTANTRAGFTLLEVLIAIAILVIGITAVMQLFPASLLQARMAAERTVTSELTNSVLGQVRASGAAALFYRRIPPQLLQLQGQEGLYSGYSATIQRLAGASDMYLQRVTFTVNFTDDRSDTFVTYVAQQ